MMNGWRKASGALLFSQDYEGYKFPEEKGRVLELIEEGLRTSESIHISAKDMMAHHWITFTHLVILKKPALPE